MLRRLALALCCMLVLVCCGGEPSSTSVPAAPASDHKNTIRQITVRSATGWLLTIETDGSGSVGFGSSAQDFAPFPQGTFDFAAIRDSLLPQSLPSGSIRKDFAVAFARAGETSTTARYISDFKTMKTLFEKAVASADKTGSRVDELYAAKPPVPDDSATPGKE